MNNPLKWLLSAAAIAAAIGISSEQGFARGGAASIMNSPGYQRRLQESRQQPSRADLQTATPRKARHRHRHRRMSQWHCIEPAVITNNRLGAWA
jgi:hypothetical protein